MKNIVLIASVALLFVACQLQDPSKQNNDLPAGVQEGTVAEVLQTNNYTYLNVGSNNNELWLAGPKTEAATGDIFYFTESMKMKDFQSKELNRNFDQIIFVSKLSKNLDDFKQTTPNKNKHEANIKTNKQDINIQKVDGNVTIADLYANKSTFENKTIIVKGVVTKYNAGIMGKNWIHLQDGTENDGKFDLAITTLAQSKVGDTLTLEGKISLNKDFGYGYKYDILLEDATTK